MSNFGHLRPGEDAKPEVLVLYGGRRRVIRRRILNAGWEIQDKTYQPLTTPDRGKIDALTAGFADLHLIRRGSEPDENKQALLVEVFETLTGVFVDEVAPVFEVGPNGLRRCTRQMIALPDTPLPPPLQKVGQSYCALAGEDGLMLYEVGPVTTGDDAARIRAVYQAPGILSVDTEHKYNGALEIQSITAFGMIPPTPAGFVGIGEGERDVEGAPTNTYRFAKGNGEIERDYDNGATGGLRSWTIRHITPATASTQPTIAPESGAILHTTGRSEADGYRVWTVQWVIGGGVKTTQDANGRRTIEATYLAVAGYTFPQPGQGLEPDGLMPDGKPRLKASDAFVFDHAEDATSHGYATIVLSFWEATNEWKRVGEALSDWEMNGLERATVLLVAKGGTAWPVMEIGVTSWPGEKEDLYLARQSPEGSTLAIRRLSLQYIQPGIISKSVHAAPISLPGLLLHEWTVWWLDPLDEGAMESRGGKMPGEVLSKRDANWEGYPVRDYTSIAGADGLKFPMTICTYNDEIDVTSPGTVRVLPPAQDEPIPFVEVIPPKHGTIIAKFEVLLLDELPAETPVPSAYNLRRLSVSAHVSTKNHHPIGYDIAQGANNKLTVSVYSDKFERSINTYPGHYYIAPDSQSGRYEFPAVIIKDEDAVAGEFLAGEITSTITLSGSAQSDYKKPAVGDLIHYKPEPVLTTLLGKVLWRVMRVTVLTAEV